MGTVSTGPPRQNRPHSPPPASSSPAENCRDILDLSLSDSVLHNHPSGDPTPSRADIDMTRQIAEAARALRIAVHDHLVVGRDGVASFKALGLL